MSKNIRRNIIGLSALSIAAGCTLFLSTPSNSQSLDVKHPAPLQSGPNKGVIDSFGGEQFWSFTAQPGPFKLTFARSDAKEGFNVGAKVGVGAIINPKVQGSSISFVENPSGTIFTGHAAGPTHVIVMVEPANSKLVRQTNEYYLTLSGNISESGAAEAKPANIIGMYNTQINDYGFVKFLADGTIETTGDARGTWKLFDEGTQSYVVNLNGITYKLTNQPGRGLVDNNGTLQFVQKH